MCVNVTPCVARLSPSRRDIFHPISVKSVSIQLEIETRALYYADLSMGSVIFHTVVGIKYISIGLAMTHKKNLAMSEFSQLKRALGLLGNLRGLNYHDDFPYGTRSEDGDPELNRIVYKFNIESRIKRNMRFEATFPLHYLVAMKSDGNLRNGRDSALKEVLLPYRSTNLINPLWS